jgi:hypothetical protein
MQPVPSLQRLYSDHFSDLRSHSSDNRCTPSSETEVVTRCSQVWLLLSASHFLYGFGSEERISGKGVLCRIRRITLHRTLDVRLVEGVLILIPVNACCILSHNNNYGSTAPLFEQCYLLVSGAKYVALLNASGLTCSWITHSTFPNLARSRA